MGSYRKKPVEIEAFHFNMESLKELEELREFLKDADVDINYLNEGKIYIETLEGTMCANILIKEYKENFIHVNQIFLN